MWLTLLRVILGFILLWKGIVFIRDTVRLKSLIQETRIGSFSQSADALTMIIAILTLVCGLFITVGLFTRLSSVVQIPILAVAVFFVNIKRMEQNGFELVLSVIVLLLLILFAIKGSGALSADSYFKRYYKIGPRRTEGEEGI